MDPFSGDSLACVNAGLTLGPGIANGGVRFKLFFPALSWTYVEQAVVIPSGQLEV